MDVLCRCVNSCFFLSHDLRRDVECYLVLLGGDDSPKTVLIKGDEVRYLNPDERSAGALIKKALQVTCGDEFIESTKGIYIRKGGLEKLLNEFEFAVLDENGEDIRDSDEIPENYILSDHMNFSAEEEELLKELPKMSAGPMVLHADHTITVILNEHDRRQS